MPFFCAFQNDHCNQWQKENEKIFSCFVEMTPKTKKETKKQLKDKKKISH